MYSVNWMVNSDSFDLSVENLNEQWHIVKTETNTSIVCNYGDMVRSVILRSPH